MPASHEFARWLTKSARQIPRRSVITKAREPLHSAEELYGIFSSDPGKQYDMREIIARIVDAGEFEEYRAESAKRCFAAIRASGPGRGHRREPEKKRADSRARSDRSAWNSAA